MWGQQLKYRSVVTKTFILAAIEFYNCIIKACVDFATVSNACGGLFRFVSFRFVSFRFVLIGGRGQVQCYADVRSQSLMAHHAVKNRNKTYGTSSYKSIMITVESLRIDVTDLDRRRGAASRRPHEIKWYLVDNVPAEGAQMTLALVDYNIGHGSFVAQPRKPPVRGMSVSQAIGIRS
jgi:hypothetical protein